MKRILLPIFVFMCAGALAAQQAPAKQTPSPQGLPAVRDLNSRLGELAAGEKEELKRVRTDYRIGPEDMLEISVFDVPELSRTVRVSASGEISLPLLDIVKVSGLTATETERLLKESLTQKYMNDPHVTVFVREFKSDPVAVIGAVRTAGNYYVQTPKRLLELLGMAGGFSETMGRTPGRTILVVRASSAGKAEDPAATSSAGELRTVEIPIKRLLEGADPKWDVWVYPGDSVKVAFAGTIYVAGNVNRPGSFPLVDFDSVSVVQALALAGGTARNASRKNAIVIHLEENGTRTERRLNLGRILKGQDSDVQLGPNDVLFVPGSMGKEAAVRALETSIQLGTGVLIWRR